MCISRVLLLYFFGIIQKLEFKKVMTLCTYMLCLIIIIGGVQCSKKVDLAQPQKRSVLEDSQLVKLAQQQKFIIPLNGRTISHTIQYIPKNSSECEFNSPSISYKSLKGQQLIFSSEDYIASLLPLRTRQIIILADPYFNIASYSTDQHFLLKIKQPKTNLINNKKSYITQGLVNPVLVASSNQEYIYYFTPTASYVFHYSNVASDIKQLNLEQHVSTITKGIQRNGFIILCTGYTGILVYRIDQKTKLLKFVQQILPKSKDDVDIPIDMQLNQQTQLLYVLNDRMTISIYLFDPKVSDSQPSIKGKVLTQYDEINLQGITYKHALSTRDFEMAINLNIEISRGRDQQTIMILFVHNSKTVVAQLIYISEKKQYSFVRYFKYSIYIKEIHVIQDIMVVVGEGILGMFPFGIHPKLIVEEFNGFMTLTPIEKIVLTQAPFFVGVSKQRIEYAGVFVSDQAGINCHLSASSTLKQIKFKANLTICGDLFPLQVNKYCQYEKTFIIKQMELTASAPVAASLWIATIVFTLLVIVGLCCVFAIQKKKQRQIRKLQLYFEQKSRKVPASSERQST